MHIAHIDFNDPQSFEHAALAPASATSSAR